MIINMRTVVISLLDGVPQVPKIFFLISCCVCEVVVV